MNKTFLKAIMQRTRLRNSFYIYRYEANKGAYNARKSLCVSQMRKAKKKKKNSDNPNP